MTPSPQTTSPRDESEEIAIEVATPQSTVARAAAREARPPPARPRIPLAHLVNAGVLAGLVAGIAGFNYVIDPFGANNAVELGFDKRAVSRKLSYWNWEAAEYAAAPAPGVLLGDSRMAKIPEDRVSEAFGLPFYNFAYGGGTMADMLSTYWFAADHAEEIGGLQHVVMGLNFNLLNDLNAYDRARQAQDLLDDPLRYYYSPFVTQASARVLLYNLGLAGATSEAPPMDPEKFWTYQLEVSARNHYQRYEYPEGLLSRLEAVAADAEQRGVALTLVYFPTHTDLQDVVAEYGLSEHHRRSKQAVYELARRHGAAFYDYDYASELTRDRASFSDPYHFTAEVAERLVDEFAGGERWMAR